VCARLRDAAKPGQVLVGHGTYLAARSAFEFRAAGARQLKGKAQPVETYECLRARPSEGFELQELQSPLVGRRDELEQLQLLVERLAPGSAGTIVTVVGEAGQGKSRLIRELRSFAAEREVTWLEGETLSYGRSISYWPFRQMARSYLGIHEDEPGSESLGRVEAAVRDLFGAEEYAETLPYLAALLALDVGPELEERIRYLDGEAMRSQIFRVMRLMFGGLTRRAPVVLVIEDVQWIDDSSARLLEHLLPLTWSAPILVCLVSRREPSTPIPSATTATHKDGSPGAALLQRTRAAYPAHVRIELEPLDATETSELVRNLVGIDEPGLHRLVVGRAEGNPFFIEEMLRSLLDTQALVPNRRTGRWQVSSLDEIEIPASLRNLILARLDRLETETRQVLDAACVVGRRFSSSVLRATVPDKEGVDDYLTELTGLELIEQVAYDPEPEYAFRHALIQEAAYTRLLLKTRAELHGRVGRAIERLFGDRLEEFYALLAHHYARAQDWAKAQDYLLRAGDQAGALAADAEALAHYDVAMRLYRRGSGERWDDVRQASLHRKIGEAYFRRGDDDRAMEHFTEGLEDLHCPYPRGRWAIAWTIARELGTQVAHRLFSFLLPTPHPATDYADERARFYFTMTWIDYFGGRQTELVLGCLFQANFCERVGHGQGMVLGLGGLGIICDLVPLKAAADWYHRRAAELAKSLRHPPSLALAALGRSYHHHMVGEWDQALANYTHARSLYRDIGDLRRESAMTYAAAWLLRLKGELSESRRLADQLIRLGEDGADTHITAWGYHALGRLQSLTGDPEHAIASLERAITLADVAHEFQSLAPAISDLSECLLRQGKVLAALHMAKRAARMARERGQRDFLHFQVRYALALVYLAAAEAQQARRRRMLLRAARRAVADALAHTRIAKDGLPAAYRLRGTAEWLGGNREAAIRWWHQSEKTARQMGARYEEAQALYESGERLGDEDRLRRAQALLAEMGARLPPGRVTDGRNSETSDPAEVAGLEI
jgi:tetratricopeptide (TPR) repeat protein